MVVVDAVTDASLLTPLPVELGRDLGVEDEGVPGKASAGAQRVEDTAEDAEPLVVPVNVEERAKRADDEVGPLLEGQLPHVAEPQIELDAGRTGALGRSGKHRRRHVDPDHPSARPHGDRDGDPTVPHRQLDHGPYRLGRERDVEVDIVLTDRARPLVVDRGKGVVLAHASDSSTKLQCVTC